MGVGDTIPFFFKADSNAFGNFISLKDFIGGGGFSPSVRMRSLFLHLQCLSSGIARMYLGGVHLKQQTKKHKMM